MGITQIVCNRKSAPKGRARTWGTRSVVKWTEFFHDAHQQTVAGFPPTTIVRNKIVGDESSALCASRNHPK
jgi:hypothetical protein